MDAVERALTGGSVIRELKGGPMNGVTPKLEHLMRRFLLAPDESAHASPNGSRHLAALPEGHRQVLLVLDRNAAPETVAADLLARMPGGSLELVILRLLPEWAQDSL